MLSEEYLHYPEELDIIVYNSLHNCWIMWHKLCDIFLTAVGKSDPGRYKERLWIAGHLPRRVATREQEST
jgi:hypothetical protein